MPGRGWDSASWSRWKLRGDGASPPGSGSRRLWIQPKSAANGAATVELISQATCQTEMPTAAPRRLKKESEFAQPSIFFSRALNGPAFWIEKAAIDQRAKKRVAADFGASS